MPELEASVAGIDSRTMMNIRVFTDFGFTSCRPKSIGRFRRRENGFATKRRVREFGDSCNERRSQRSTYPGFRN
jgi:hypothetical protein